MIDKSSNLFSLMNCCPRCFTIYWTLKRRTDNTTCKQLKHSWKCHNQRLTFVFAENLITLQKLRLRELLKRKLFFITLRKISESGNRFACRWRNFSSHWCSIFNLDKIDTAGGSKLNCLQNNKHNFCNSILIYFSRLAAYYIRDRHSNSQLVIWLEC